MGANEVMCLTVVSVVVNMILLIYLVMLASRFVTAFESMAGSLGRIASKQSE